MSRLTDEDLLYEVLCSIQTTLETIDKKMEEDTKSYKELRKSMDDFRDEIRGSQRRTAEALTISQRNAERSRMSREQFLEQARRDQEAQDAKSIPR